jgi:hypothetical protein
LPDGRKEIRVHGAMTVIDRDHHRALRCVRRRSGARTDRIRGCGFRTIGRSGVGSAASLLNMGPTLPLPYITASLECSTTAP